MKYYFPKGKVLTALEKNVLKVRLFEMGLVLYYIEDLKTDTLASIRATHPKLLPDGTKNLYSKMWAHLVTVGIITQTESDEIQSFIDYRNDIAHKLYTLTADISRDPDIIEWSKTLNEKYKSDALKRICNYRDKIENGMMGKYVGVLSMRSLLFEAAEKTYKEEIVRLRRKIGKQAKAMRQEINNVNKELKMVPKEFYDEYRQWKVVKDNGNISEYGKGVCQRLFALGLSPLSVAYITKMSFRAMKRQNTLS